MVVSFRFFLTLNPDDGSKPTPTMETYNIPDGEGKFISVIRNIILLPFVLLNVSQCKMFYFRNKIVLLVCLGFTEITAPTLWEKQLNRDKQNSSSSRKPVSRK